MTSSRGTGDCTQQTPADREEPPSRLPAQPQPPSGISLHIVHSSLQPINLDTQWLRDHLHAALPLLAKLTSKPLGNISILLADDQRMSSLHRHYMGIDAPTDVLTFDQSDPGDRSIHADIALGVEVAQRQARQRNHAVERELLLYAIHGLLHTLGFNDHDDASYTQMHAEEDRILTAIGVGPTFSSGGDSGDQDHQSARQSPPAGGDA